MIVRSRNWYSKILTKSQPRLQCIFLLKKEGYFLKLLWGRGWAKSILVKDWFLKP